MTIPKELFRKLEYQLHHAGRELQNKRRRLENTRRDLYMRIPGGISSSGSGGFSSGIPERYALRIAQMEQEVRQAELWVRLIARLKRSFRGEKEHVLFQSFYGKDISVNQFAKQNHYDRQTIDNYRDRVISIFALMAVEQKLVCVADYFENF